MLKIGAFGKTFPIYSVFFERRRRTLSMRIDRSGKTKCAKGKSMHSLLKFFALCYLLAIFKGILPDFLMAIIFFVIAIGCYVDSEYGRCKVCGNRNCRYRC